MIIDFSKSLRSGGTSRVVMKAMGLFGGMQMLVILCGVVRTKIVALLLGATGVGLFSIFNNALTLLSTATQLGLRTSAVRETASGTTPDTTGVSTVRYWGRLLALFGLIVSLIAAPLLSLSAFGHYTYTPAFMALAPAVALMTLTASAQAIMQGHRQLGALARSTAWGVIGGLLVSIPLIYLLGIHSIVPVVVAYAVAAWVSTRLCAHKTPSSPRLTDYASLWRAGLPMLRLGGYMTAASIVSEAAAYAFTAWLVREGGTDTVGIYQSGYTIMTRYVGMVFTALSVEYYPRLASANAHPRRQQIFIRHEITLLMWVLCGVLLLFIPLSPLAIRLLYSSDFLEAAPYIVLATPGVVLRGYSWCISFIMLARGDGRLFMLTDIGSTLIGFTLSILGYRLGGIAGLGVAYTLWFAAYAVMMTLVNRLVYRARPSLRVTLIFSSVLTAVTAAALLYILI